MSGIIVIGIDHGWSTMKTDSQVFATGVKKVREERRRHISGCRASYLTIW